MATSLGEIAGLLKAHQAPRTPLQKRLAVLGRRLAAAALGVCVIVFSVGVLRGEDVALMFLVAVSLAVAAIPEALPAVVTIALALGAKRMARQHALIRKLPAVETLARGRPSFAPTRPAPSPRAKCWSRRSGPTKAK